MLTAMLLVPTAEMVTLKIVFRSGRHFGPGQVIDTGNIATFMSCQGSLVQLR